jgi:DNA-binding IclR family transcriptional regulator
MRDVWRGVDAITMRGTGDRAGPVRARYSQYRHVEAKVTILAEAAGVTNSRLSPSLQLLVNNHLATMDHVALLLALREGAEHVHSAPELAKRTGLDETVVRRVLDDLVSAHLVGGGGEAFRYDPARDVAPAIAELAEMYRTKPVSLVRAMYERPPRAVQSFADAFRIRKEGE